MAGAGGVMGLGFAGMKVLIGVYIVLALVFLWEKQWPFALYWICAGGLTTAVLWGMK